MEPLPGQSLKGGKMTIIDVLGYSAAIATTASFFPQVYKVFKTKKTEDLSLGMFILFCLGTCCWSIYGLMMKSFPITLANTVTMLLTLYILYMKVKNVGAEKNR
jgi:MtN3 and saliva related transmembrane protein